MHLRAKELVGIWIAKIYAIDENEYQEGILDQIGLTQASRLLMGNDMAIGIKCIPYPFSKFPNNTKETVFGSYEFCLESQETLEKAIERGYGGFIIPRANIDGIVTSSASIPKSRSQLVVDGDDYWYNIFAIPNIMQKDDILALIHGEENSYIISMQSREPESMWQRIYTSSKHGTHSIKEV